MFDIVGTIASIICAIIILVPLFRIILRRVINKHSILDNLKQFVITINHQLSYHGLGWEDYLLFINEHKQVKKSGILSSRYFRMLFNKDIDDTEKETAAYEILVEHKVPGDINALRLVAMDIENMLYVELPVQLLEIRLVKYGRIARSGLSILLFISVFYMVVGAILTEPSNLIGTNNANPVVAIGVLMVLILILGMFEGLQISIATLRYKDLYSLRWKYPQAYSINTMFRGVLSTNRFFAGRQLFVVIIVFVAAQLTSFPSIQTWPLTDVPFPQWMSPWFETVFYKLGILGALFVLWLGQLTPQFLANTNPQRFLNLFGARFMLSLALIVDSLGLTDPGKWFARRWKGQEEYISPSPIERYQSNTISERGYGRVGLKKVWTIHRNSATLDYHSTIIFTQPGFQTITDEALFIKGSAINITPNRTLYNQDDSIPNREVVASFFYTSPIPNDSGWNCVTQQLEPSYGEFLKDDILSTDIRVVFDQAEEDQISILQPTKYILFRAKFTEAPKTVNAGVKVVKIDESISKYDLINDKQFKVRQSKHGTLYVQYIEFYPEVGNNYIFSWEVGY